MKALFIGGTGTISGAISELALQRGVELTLLTRSGKGPEGAELLTCDINDADRAATLLKGRSFDVVADFVAFRPEQVERDIQLFQGRTEQYIYISSASAYQKPLRHPIITESTPLCNPYWQYSRDKIACENLLMAAYRAEAFPVTIVRPSHTYGNYSVPVSIHGKNGSWQVLARMLEGKPVIVHGDGLSLSGPLRTTRISPRDFTASWEILMRLARQSISPAMKRSPGTLPLLPSAGHWA